MLKLPVSLRSFVNAQTNGLQTHKMPPKFQALIRAEDLLSPYYLCGQNTQTHGPLVKKCFEFESPDLKHNEEVQTLRYLLRYCVVTLRIEALQLMS
jgi:hypothetical protein